MLTFALVLAAEPTAAGGVADPQVDPRHAAPLPPGFAGCDGESFRAVGSFPRALAAVPAVLTDDLPAPDRRFVGAAFATVADEMARRNPSDAVPRPATEPGLRGGVLRWDREARVITMQDVRFVADLAVTGTIELDDEHRATGELRAVETGGLTRLLMLRWEAFVAENETDVVSRLDGIGFAGRVPIH
jgi:hypothetical protein